MKAHHITAPRIAALLLAMVAASPVTAQDSHTVRIRDGVVSVDGRPVPADQLPPSLRATDHQMQLEFSGTARFHIDGVDYGVENGRIVELPPGEEGLFVIFGDDDGRFIDMSRSPGVTRRFRLDGPLEGTIGTYLQVLDEQAEEFEKIGELLAAPRVEKPADVAVRLRRQAEETATMVRAFPRVEVQTYLHGLQNRDRSLYQQLMREQEMEVASSQLAHRILSTTDPATRLSLGEDLRRQLDEIFELKQQNRRDEIAQLEKQLGELRQQLAAREANRETIVARRLEALIGESHR